MNKNLFYSETWKQAGVRERYAMEKGRLYSYKEKANNHQMWRFTYPDYYPYQDANGALFDVTEGVWVN